MRETALCLSVLMRKHVKHKYGIRLVRIERLILNVRHGRLLIVRILSFQVLVPHGTREGRRSSGGGWVSGRSAFRCEIQGCGAIDSRCLEPHRPFSFTPFGFR